MTSNTIIDNLESDRADAALSARQGKELNLPIRSYYLPDTLVNSLLQNGDYEMSPEEAEEIKYLANNFDKYCWLVSYREDGKQGEIMSRYIINHNYPLLIMGFTDSEYFGDSEITFELDADPVLCYF